MPRDAQGIYTLPLSNPVISGTLIESDNWANPTMEDLGVEITNSLDRDGLGDMRAPLGGVDGSLAAPTFRFSNSTNSGMFLDTANNALGFSYAGAQVFYVTEAPQDAKNYWRTDAGWVEDTVLDAPIDGQKYNRLDQGWAVPDVEEAPIDGGQYVRVDGAWILVDIPPGTIISDTPPANPLGSQLWFQSSTGIEWIWYEDGNSDQWVETGPSPVGNLTDSTGAVQAFAAAVPEGWLTCNGAAVSRITYDNLFTYLGTLYGIGDGSTTFNVPDLRGEFVRGFDAGRGTDPARVLGSGQGDEFRTHTHVLNTYESGAVGGNGRPQEGTSGNLSTITTVSSGGNETRPVNVAMNYGIKT